MIEAREMATHHTTYRLEKYHEDAALWAGREDEFFELFEPYEVIEGEENILVNTGIGLMEDLLIGAGGTVFSNANARLGVGSSNTAAAASQTDLLGGSQTRKAMDATFPSRASQTLTFKSTYTSGEANHDWKEWGIFNAAAAGTMLNRKVQDFGTKASGTWVLTATVSIS